MDSHHQCVSTGNLWFLEVKLPPGDWQCRVGKMLCGETGSPHPLEPSVRRPVAGLNSPNGAPVLHTDRVAPRVQSPHSAPTVRSPHNAPVSQSPSRLLPRAATIHSRAWAELPLHSSPHKEAQGCGGISGLWRQRRKASDRHREFVDILQFPKGNK